MLDSIISPLRPGDAIGAFERAGGASRPGKVSHVSVKMLNGKLRTFSGTCLLPELWQH